MFEPNTHTNFLQVAQTSALADRQGEERRILDLENAVKSVSLMDVKKKKKKLFKHVLTMSDPGHSKYVMITTVTLILKWYLCCCVCFVCVWGVVGAGETGPAVTGVSAEGEQDGRGGGAEGPLCCSGAQCRGGFSSEG